MKRIVALPNAIAKATRIILSARIMDTLLGHMTGQRYTQTRLNFPERFDELPIALSDGLSSLGTLTYEPLLPQTCTERAIAHEMVYKEKTQPDGV
ncbi:MAG: hypothetical protein JWM63_4317 [Gammaproteobacteria bacterium]|jgi:hypothetical protein|nr:hypothetical protein [Gammaproteobacteria bacterium]